MNQGRELFSLNDSVGTRSNGCKLTMNKMRWFLILRAVNFWNSSQLEKWGQEICLVSQWSLPSLRSYWTRLLSITGLALKSRAALV